MGWFFDFSDSIYHDHGMFFWLFWLNLPWSWDGFLTLLVCVLSTMIFCFSESTLKQEIMNGTPNAGRTRESSCGNKIWVYPSTFRMFLQWLEIKSRIPHWSVSCMSPLVQGSSSKLFGGLQSYWYYFPCTGTMDKNRSDKVRSVVSWYDYKPGSSIFTKH